MSSVPSIKLHVDPANCQVEEGVLCLDLTAYPEFLKGRSAVRHFPGSTGEAWLFRLVHTKLSNGTPASAYQRYA